MHTALVRSKVHTLRLNLDFTFIHYLLVGGRCQWVVEERSHPSLLTVALARTACLAYTHKPNKYTVSAALSQLSAISHIGNSLAIVPKVLLTRI